MLTKTFYLVVPHRIKGGTMQCLTLNIYYEKSELNKVKLKKHILEYFGVESLDEISEITVK